MRIRARTRRPPRSYEKPTPSLLLPRITHRRTPLPHPFHLVLQEFRRAYHAELAAHPEHWWKLLGIAGKGELTLLYGAKDTEHNNARVLAEFLEDEMERVGEGSSPVCYAGKKE